MRRLIAGVVAAVMSCVLISPPLQAMQWDPNHPPIPVDRQVLTDKPSGDDGGWGDIEKSPSCSSWFRLDLWIWDWVILQIAPTTVKHSTTESSVVREGPNGESIAPAGSN